MKVRTIVELRNNKMHEYTGTVAELTKMFGYTLLCGYEQERIHGIKNGKKKVNLFPKTHAQLVKALENAGHNTYGGYNPTIYMIKN